jgi:NDP-sugar pyrophosphorylase family protein
LQKLWKRGFRNVVVCGNGSMGALGVWVERQQFPGMAVRFLSDGKPRGTAGCVRDAVAEEAGGQVLIIKGAVVWMEDADLLLKQHQAGQAALTVFTQDAFAGAGSEARPAGIYVCETSALAAVPREGYQDVKEQLIPNLLRKGERVRAVPVPGGTLSYRNVSEYLQVVGQALTLPEKFALDLDGFEDRGDGTWAAGGVAVAPTARLYGPVVLLEGCTVEDQTLVVGPAVIGRRARVGAGAVVTGSVLWDEASVGPGASVSGSLLDAGARVGRGLQVENGAIPGRGTAKGSRARDVRREGQRWG